MLIRQPKGNIATFDIKGLEIDVLELEWFETPKKNQHKVTKGGAEISIKLSKEVQRLTEGDIIHSDDKKAIVVKIIPSDAIVVSPKSMVEMAALCYEVGNKHLPIFLQNNEVLIPFEEPVFRWIISNGLKASKETRVLHNLLKSNVEAHEHMASVTPLFEKQF